MSAPPNSEAIPMNSRLSIPAEPERRDRGELGVAAADPAEGEAREGDGQHDAAGGEVHAEGVEIHAGKRRETTKAAASADSQPVGDGHGQEIGSGGKGHAEREDEERR